MPTLDCLKLALHGVGVVRCAYDPLARAFSVPVIVPGDLRNEAWEEIAQQYFAPAIARLLQYVLTENFREVHRYGMSGRYSKAYNDFIFTLSVSRGDIP